MRGVPEFVVSATHFTCLCFLNSRGCWEEGMQEELDDLCVVIRVHCKFKLFDGLTVLMVSTVKNEHKCLTFPQDPVTHL